MSAMIKAGIQRVGRFAKTSFAVVGFGVTATAGISYAYRELKKHRDAEANKTKKHLLVLPFHKIKLIDKHEQGDGLSEALLQGRNNNAKKEKISLEDLVETIHEAAQDSSIVGLVGEFGHGRTFTAGGMGDLEEIRTALRIFKESHRVHSEPNFEHAKLLHKKGNDTPRPMIAYADTLESPVASNNPDYYLASIFTEIHLQKQGQLNLFGFGGTIPFLRLTMEKYGARVYCYKHGLYKNAPNTFTESYLTREHRENVENYLFALNEHQNDTIAASRKHAKLTPELWKLIQNSGSFTPEAALKMGLIDSIGDKNPLDTWLYHPAEVLGPSILPPKTDDVNTITLGQYRKVLAQRKQQQQKDKMKAKNKDKSQQRVLFYIIKKLTESHPWLENYMKDQSWYQTLKQQDKEEEDKKETIATLTIKGTIDNKMVRKLEPALIKIKKDKSIKCVVIKVDSPGGTIDASETLLQEFKTLPNKPKIIVCFGNVAASGGYYIASGADQIFASPTTITGSIGVFGIRMDLSGVTEQYGVRFGHVATSDFALSNSPFASVTKQQHANSQRSVDRAYERFRQVVSDGRDLGDEDVLKLAEGRVWTGSQAKHNGLVDELGGWYRAIEYARNNYCIDGEAAQVVDMSEDKSFWAKLNKFLSEGGPEQKQQSATSKSLVKDREEDANNDPTSLLFGGGGYNNLTLPKTIPKKAFGMYLTMDENAAIRAMLSGDSDNDNDEQQQ